MPIPWANLRIPVPLMHRLKRQALRLEASHQAGRRVLPTVHSERVPLYYALEVLLDEVEAHQVRSRRGKRSAG